MNMIKNECDIDVWAYNNFGNVQLFDKRRTKRLVDISARMAKNPGCSLASLYPEWYDTKAVYNLINQDVMTPDTIQENHRILTNKNIGNWQGDVLLIEDGSEFEWNRLEPIEGLGPVGSGREGDQGFILHSTLAVGIVKGSGKNSNRLSTRMLGLPCQQYYVRPPKREKRKKRDRGDVNLETDLWKKVINKKILPKKEHNLIRVCDRAADIYEVIIETKDNGYDYIIRAKHNRSDSGDTEIRLFESLREMPAIGLTKLERRGRDGFKSRTIPLNVTWQEVSLQAPERPSYKKGQLPPLELTVVRAWGWDSETNELIEWFLYTSLAVNDIEGAIKIVNYYSCRWIIEDYHKAIKSGLKAESLQLESAHGLFAAIAIMSVIALRLVDLRESMRVNPEAPAEESGLDTLEIKVLSVYLKRELKTVKCVALAIGKLGGHLNRKSDGMPGIKTLWLGMTKLIALVEGAKLMMC